MFQAVRTTIMAATAAFALGLFGGAAQAATLSDGDVIALDPTVTYVYEADFEGIASGGDTVSFEFTIDESQLPLSLGAITINLASFGATISGFYMSMFDGVNTTNAVIEVTSFGEFGFAFTGTLRQAFTDSLSQTLTIGWDSFDATEGSIQISASVAAIPLPAGGLLLITAIGGLAALRRRKALAA